MSSVRRKSSSKTARISRPARTSAPSRAGSSSTSESRPATGRSRGITGRSRSWRRTGNLWSGPRPNAGMGVADDRELPYPRHAACPGGLSAAIADTARGCRSARSDGLCRSRRSGRLRAGPRRFAFRRTSAEAGSDGRVAGSVLPRRSTARPRNALILLKHSAGGNASAIGRLALPFAAQGIRRFGLRGAFRPVRRARDPTIG